MTPLTYTFREATSKDELLALLRLRYDTYRNSRLAGFVPENAQGLDLDKYDPWARHFGLYLRNEPVGYIRVVQEERGPAWGTICDIACTEAARPDLDGTKPNVPFPLMNYFPDKEAVSNCYKTEYKNGNKGCEAGRLIVRMDQRTPGLSRFLIESALATYFFSWNFQYALISCALQHGEFYRRYGFTEIESSNIHSIHGISLRVYKAFVKQIPLSRSHNLEKLALEFINNRYVSYMPGMHLSLVSNKSIVSELRRVAV